MPEIRKIPLTIEEKVQICDFVPQNLSTSHTRVAEIFTELFKKKVDRRSILNYIRSSENLKTSLATMANKKRCLTDYKYKIIDEDLNKWIDFIEDKGVCYNDKIIKEKALEIAERHNLTDFKCSNGFLQNFKKRHKINERILSGEGFDSEKNDYSLWYIEMAEKMKKYDDKDIYNCDETGLIYKMCPSRSLKKTRKGFKKHKDRISILFCVNKDGSERLKPLILGKFKNPRAFKNFKYSCLCDYSYNNKAWMTKTEFNNWLLSLDTKFKKEERKVLMLMDNCPAHKLTYNPKNIEIVYLPKNSTSVTQPLDAGIIKSFKSRFHHMILSKIVSEIDSDSNVEALFKKLTMKDAVLYASQAWNEITNDVIINCWRSAGYSGVKDDNIIESCGIADYDLFIKELNILDPIKYDEYIGIKIDENDLFLDTFNEEFSELNATTVSDDECKEEVLSSENDCEECNKPITLTDAKKCYETLKQYILSNNEIHKELIDNVMKIESFIYSMKSKMRQTKITDFLIKK